MTNKPLTAVEALQEAQRISFGPFLFQSIVSLKKLGALDYIFRNRRKGGVTIEEIANEVGVSEYGIDVLLEIAETSNIVIQNADHKFKLTKVGYFLNSDEMTNINLNFTNDVCYKGLYHLNDSIKNEKPEGLKELGNWKTIYEGLSILPAEAKKSWFDFDHYYSDNSFDEALDIVFKNKPKLLFDIGANTGKFSMNCCNYDNEVTIKMLDLPIQLNVALENVKKNGLENRISGHEIDLLVTNPKIPKGADAIWMSQFLDCFSKSEILNILKACVTAMDAGTELFIMELFTDRQKIENAKFSLQATSLYFTVMANGNSKMYRSQEMIDLIEEAGLIIVDDLDIKGSYHTLLTCRKK